MQKTLVLIAGPTASGKTAAAISLAQTLGTEIVSADARQVFNEMRIGTASPTTKELTEARHHLVGHRSVTDPYDASVYSSEAEKIVSEIFDRREFAILCGGSGLYIRAFLEGLDTMPQVPETIRKAISEEYLKKGLDWLRGEVRAADPVWYEKADVSNHRRLIRALEVFRATGKSLSSFQSGKSKEHNFRIIRIGIDLPKETLHERIDRRIDNMVREGLIKEAESLIGYRHLPALQTVGYQEIFEYLDGMISMDEAVEKIRRNTRRYAKRQMTWFRKTNEMHWLPDGQTVVNYVLNLINKTDAKE